MVHLRLPHDWHIEIGQRTDGVHALYANFFLRQLALYTFGLFVPLFLLKLAQDLYRASLVEALVLIAIYYLVIRIVYLFFVFPVVNVIRLLGTRWSIFISNFLLIVDLASLSLAEQERWLIIVSIFTAALHIPLYWLSYHFLLSADSHDEVRGREVGKLRMVERIGAIIGPILGGAIAARWGFPYLFATSIVLVAISSIPPFFMRHHTHDKAYWPGDVLAVVGERRNWGVLLSIGAAAAKDMTDGIFVPVFAFLLLAGYEQIGLFFAITGLVTIGVYWLVGWLFDNYSKRRLLKASVLLNCLIWVGRALTTSAGALYLVESAKRIVNPMLLVTHDAMVYHWGRKEPLRYMLARSVIWQLGAVVWLLLLTVGFWFGLELRAVFAATAVIVLGHMAILRAK